MSLDAAIIEWRGILGPDQVLGGNEAQQAYGSDTGIVQRTIPAALLIADAGIIPAILRVANHHRVPVYPISTGHNWGYGTALPVRDGCVILDLSRLQTILHFDAELGVVTVEPGVTQGMLAAFLDAGHHPYLVPVTGAGPTCSLMGNALERGFGITPHHDHFGAVTDIEAVLADGSLYRTALHEAGGEDLARLFKWGLGPYSVGLFSQGGFGIVTRMSIVLARRPDVTKACIFSLENDASLEIAVERIRSILQRLPGTVGGVNLMNRHRVLAMTAAFPPDLLGTDNLISEEAMEELGRHQHVAAWTGFATLYGTRDVVRAAQKEIRASLSGVATRTLFFSSLQVSFLRRAAGWIPGKAGPKLARTLNTLYGALELADGRPNETALPLAYWRNVKAPAGSWRDPARDGCGLIWYSPLVPMRPTMVRAFADTAQRILLEHRIEPLITFTSMGDKLFGCTVPLVFERQLPDARDRANACYTKLLHAGRELGCFPYRFGSDKFEELAAFQKDSLLFHRRLRAAVDQHDVVAPGRYS